VVRPLRITDLARTVPVRSGTDSFA